MDPALLSRTVAPPPPDAISIRWLGAAGFELRTTDRTLLIDPYLTRAPLLALAFGRLEPDRDALQHLGADLILIAHSHADHLLDAPAISARTGAPILASADACRLANSMDDAHCVAAPIGRRFRERGFDLTAIPAAHGETIIGVPIDGTNDRPLRSSPHAFEMRAGPVFIWVVRANGVTVVHASTAGLPLDPLALKKLVPGGADVLLLTLGLRDNTPGYPRHLIDVLRPKVIIPCHTGLETYTLEAELPEDVQADLQEFAREEGPRVRILKPFEAMIVARGAR